MLYDIKIEHIDGSVERFDDMLNVPLDYWNVRQFRLLLYRLSDSIRLNHGRLVITPIVDEIL